ncbi:MAG: class I SAM-dependent methyltransferase [Fibromonadales bacterium]|nr:class I SAM-dependent methyltransferase [Fibromonadales bacterium]
MPEKIDCEMFNAITPDTYEFMEMHASEKRFLFGLIRHFKPKNILEVGVSSGGGAGLMLNAIKDMKESTLTSIDFLKQAYRYPDKPVGFVALRENASNPQWTLVSGKDPSEVIECFDKKFDFALIDTQHIHPIETMNFLSVLPFLEDGAIVVLHDLSLYMHASYFSDLSNFPRISLATRYLFNSVVGEKITVSSNDKEYISTWKLPNIGAFQVTGDTRKYIDGVFYSLALPWGFTPEDNILDSVHNIIENHYDKTKLALFDDAVRANYYLNAKKMKSTTDLPGVLQRYKGKYILFGQKAAGNYIKMIRGMGFDLPLEIWDNKMYDQEMFSVPVVKPHEKLDNEVAIIITVKTQLVCEKILSGFSSKLRRQAYWFNFVY